jgi:hypothetical protein
MTGTGGGASAEPICLRKTPRLKQYYPQAQWMCGELRKLGFL